MEYSNEQNQEITNLQSDIAKLHDIIEWKDGEINGLQSVNFSLKEDLTNLQAEVVSFKDGSVMYLFFLAI